MSALLQVQDLTVRFGGLTAVDRLSFDVSDDEVLGLIGPNGAGKTTVFNAVTGFVRPTSGSITFDGAQLSRRPPQVVARAGLVRTFQKRSFFPHISVFANVRTAAVQPYVTRAEGRPDLSAGADGDATHGDAPEGDADRVRSGRRGRASRPRERVESLLGLVGLWDKRHHEAASLPYGEQRILGVALALAARPRLLMLDEPCAGMTPLEIDRMIHLIARLRELRLPMVVVEHQMRFLMGISDRVVVLDHGVKLAEGEPAAVRANPDVIEAYLGRGTDAHAKPA